MLIYPSGSSDRYDLNGRLISETDPAGRLTAYGYDPAYGRLSTITDPFGHVVTLGYDTNNRVATVTTPDNQVIGYSYDASYNLAQVTYPDRTAKLYYYQNTSFPNALTGIAYVDTAGNITRYSRYGYYYNTANATDPNNGKATLTTHLDDAGNPREQFTLSYDTATQTTVTDAAGTQEVMTFATNLGVKNLVSKQNLADNKLLSQTFDANNNLTCKKDEENHVTLYSYNASNQKVSETSGLSGSDCATCLSNPASCNVGGTGRVTTYQYLSPTLDLPTRITSPSVYAGGGKTVTIGYTDPAHPLLPTTITQSGYTPSGSAVSRTVTLGYNSAGQVASIDGPRTDVNDVTTLHYYTCTTGGGCGQLSSVTNALGQTTTYDSYDGAGRVTQTTDPNGLKTVYAYDERGRVKTITETPSGGTSRMTSFTYHPAGMVATSTDPDGVVLRYQYDAALQRRHVLDPLNNDHAYAYDTRGNPNAESLYDASGTLVRTEGRVFDARNHLYQVTRAGVVTTTVNDALGVLHSLTDGNNHVTSYTPDALNRIVQMADPVSAAAGKSVTYGYDVNDHVTAVKAANDLTTSYTVDDLGNVLSEVSPDRGTLTYTYDAAGNVKTRTDATFTTTWTYDALNRVLSQQSSDSSTGRYDYYYDSCRKGSLCNIQKNGGLHLFFTYDSFGRRNYELTSAWLYTQYVYTPAGRLKQITYPDGRTVDYTFDGAGQVKQVTTTKNSVTTTLASSIVHYPFGPVQSLSYGNGLGVHQFLDTAYRPTLRFDGSFFESLTRYDGADNITQRYAPGIQSYAYDNANRLTAATDTASFGTLGWTYDLNGNRQTDTRNGTATTYTYQPTGSNWLYQFGNNYRLQGYPGTTAYATGPGFLGYDGYLRLVNANGTASYTYDAFNRRLSKTVGGVATRFQYGFNGELLAETDGTTTLDYVYLDGLPIARIDNGTTIYYYHTDHLGTPQTMTDSTGTVVWAAKVEPFGNANVTTATITNNLRFPGQYYDAETGLHYNWNRYYDPKTGRYITSDPIGLRGGLNTYAYVHSNPLKFTDPTGLICFWSQASGDFVCVSPDGQVYLSSWECPGTYSGHGLGLNNPALQGETDTGPLPRGDWQVIGGPVTIPGINGPIRDAIPLVPMPDNEVFNFPNRDPLSFYLHGPHANDKSDSSHGCPIMSHSCRMKIPYGEIIRVY